MTTSSGRKHAGTGPASDQRPVPEPTFAERARTLVYLGRVGSLSTLSRKQPGFPFGSVMPYGLDDHGRPLIPDQHHGYAYTELAGRRPRQLAGYPGRHRRPTARRIEGHAARRRSAGTEHRVG